MSYFSRFPMMIYDVKGNDNYKLLPDILRRVKQRAGIKAGQFIFSSQGAGGSGSGSNIGFTPIRYGS